jgi:hypothetical protein
MAINWAVRHTVIIAHFSDYICITMKLDRVDKNNWVH